MAAGAQANPGQPPLPPDVQAQAQPEQAQSVFADQGLGKPQQGMQVVQQIGQQIGLAFLVMLMAFAFYNDINRLVSG